MPRTCPFCAEEIKEAAIKCKHCGEWLNVESSIPVLPSISESSNIPALPKSDAVAETPPVLTADESNKSSKESVVIGVGLVILVVILGIPALRFDYSVTRGNEARPEIGDIAAVSDISKQYSAQLLENKVKFLAPELVAVYKDGVNGQRKEDVLDKYFRLLPEQRRAVDSAVLEGLSTDRADDDMSIRELHIMLAKDIARSWLVDSDMDPILLKSKVNQYGKGMYRKWGGEPAEWDEYHVRNVKISKLEVHETRRPSKNEIVARNLSNIYINHVGGAEKREVLEDYFLLDARGKREVENTVVGSFAERSTGERTHTPIDVRYMLIEELANDELSVFHEEAEAVRQEIIGEFFGDVTEEARASIINGIGDDLDKALAASRADGEVKDMARAYIIAAATSGGNMFSSEVSEALEDYRRLSKRQKNEAHKIVSSYYKFAGFDYSPDDVATALQGAIAMHKVLAAE